MENLLNVRKIDAKLHHQKMKEIFKFKIKINYMINTSQWCTQHHNISSTAYVLLCIFSKCLIYIKAKVFCII